MFRISSRNLSKLVVAANANMSCSPLTAWCARASFVYVVACLVYIALTRHMGTPFRDSLSEEQLEIKKCSAARRKRMFGAGIAAGVTLVALVDPFQK